MQDISEIKQIADLLKVCRELKKLSSVIHRSELLKWQDFTAILKKCIYTSLKLWSLVFCFVSNEEKGIG